MPSNSTAIKFARNEEKVKVEIDLANLGTLQRTGKEGANGIVYVEHAGKRFKIQVLCYESKLKTLEIE